jgi:hypothetical protein
LVFSWPAVAPTDSDYWALGMSQGSFGVRSQSVSRALLTLSVLQLTIYRQNRDRRLLLVFAACLRCGRICTAAS